MNTKTSPHYIWNWIVRPRQVIKAVQEKLEQYAETARAHERAMAEWRLKKLRAECAEAENVRLRRLVWEMRKTFRRMKGRDDSMDAEFPHDAINKWMPEDLKFTPIQQTRKENKQ